MKTKKRKEMLHPEIVEMLNRERLKDLDREAQPLRYIRLARQSRRCLFRAAANWVGDLMIALGNRLKAKDAKEVAAVMGKKP